MTKAMRLYNVKFTMICTKKRIVKNFQSYQVKIYTEQKTLTWTSYYPVAAVLNIQSLYDEFFNFIQLILYYKYNRKNIKDKIQLRDIERRVMFYELIFESIPPEDILQEYKLKYKY